MRHQNNFDFVRLLAALAVLVSHVWPLHDMTFPLGDLGAVGVFTFFAISGYLVSASWERDPNAFRFIARRALRIFPGYIVAILAAAFVVGPLVTSLPVRAYFSDDLLWQYCSSIFLYPMTFELPGVFVDNVYRTTVNGSLWTLPMEVFMYGVLVVMGVGLTRIRKGAVPILVTIIALTFALEIRGQKEIFLTMNAEELWRNASSFAIGALFWHLRDRIVFLPWAWLPLSVFLFFTHGTGAPETWALMLFVPYASLSFALHPLPVIQSTGRFGDVSYGVYIYAFLIQQTLMHLAPHLPTWVFLVDSIVLSIIAGFLSWHLVEKHALRLKPGMRIRESQRKTPTDSRPIRYSK